MNPDELIAQVAALRAENAKLKDREAKREARKNKSPALQNIPNPDPDHFVSFDNVATMLVDNGVLSKAEVTDARTFVKFMSLKALAQSKPAGTNGRGKLLFLTGDVMDAIKHIRTFAGQGG